MKKKRITIIRHGKPQAHSKYKMTTMLKGLDIKTFTHDWNTCELSSDNSISEELKSAIVLPDFFISSKLKRSRDSLHFLGVSKFLELELLNEAEFPNGFWEEMKMPFAFWGIIIRFMWLFGLEKNAETYRDFKNRTKKAYHYIDSLFTCYNHIGIMGHGMLNTEFKRELRQNGWTHITNSGGHGYWSFDIFEN